MAMLNNQRVRIKTNNNNKQWAELLYNIITIVVIYISLILTVFNPIIKTINIIMIVISDNNDDNTVIITKTTPITITITKKQKPSSQFKHTHIRYKDRTNIIIVFEHIVKSNNWLNGHAHTHIYIYIYYMIYICSYIYYPLQDGAPQL